MRESEWAQRNGNEIRNGFHFTFVRSFVPLHPRCLLCSVCAPIAMNETCLMLVSVSGRNKFAHMKILKEKFRCHVIIICDGAALDTVLQPYSFQSCVCLRRDETQMSFLLLFSAAVGGRIFIKMIICVDCRQGVGIRKGLADAYGASRCSFFWRRNMHAMTWTEEKLTAKECHSRILLTKLFILFYL